MKINQSYHGFVMWCRYAVENPVRRNWIYPLISARKPQVQSIASSPRLCRAVRWQIRKGRRIEISLVARNKVLVKFGVEPWHGVLTRRWR